MKLKLMLALATFALSGLLISGNTGAYLTDNKPAQSANFTAGTVAIEFANEAAIDDPSTFAVEKQVVWTIQNTGSIDVYLRLEVLFPNLNEEEISQLRLSSGENWMRHDDGYFYSIEALEPGGIEIFQLNISIDDWQEGEFQVDITVDAIQETNNARENHWFRS